jgi:epoxyqueuosine reductase
MARPDAVAKRLDVRQAWPEARSVISVAMSYRTHDEWDMERMGGIARYARGVDYHDVIPGRLRQLLAWLQEQTPCEGKVYVDTGPVLEREWAQRAGLGWIGKNTLLMSREFGSYVLLGELLVDIELPPDEPHLEQYCGTCTRCMDACPTQAIVAPHELDAGRCISYHTIENRKLAPIELRESFQDWVFGCDICQEVCPWNGKAGGNPGAYSAEPELWRRAEMPELREWTALPQEEFSRRLKGSPIKRAKRRGMRRNAVRGMRNRRKMS